MTQTQNPVAERVSLWHTKVRAWRHRSTGFGIWLRAVLCASGFTATALATPGYSKGVGWLLLAAGLSLIAMARPGGIWAAGVQFAAVFGWITGTFTQEQPSLILAFLIGAALYVHHTTSAMAALWRVDVAVSGPVWRSWLLRTGTVTVSAAGLALGIAALAGQPLPVPTVVLVGCGLLGAVALVAGLVHLSQRH